MAVALAGIAAIFHFKEHPSYLVWLLILYCASFSFSLGAVIWVYISEIFPNSVREEGQSLGSLTPWVMNAIISGLFPLVATYSRAAPFVFFSAMMLVMFIVVLFFYPETKNTSLEQIEKPRIMSIGDYYEIHGVNMERRNLFKV